MDSIDSKVFVVGVPRSGTTLVQSILASHPGVFATRETHWMVNVRRPPSRTWALDHLLLRPSRVRGAVAYLQEQCPDLYQEYIARRPACRTLTQAARVLDTLFSAVAQAQEKTAWVEKSPEHAGYAILLEKAISDAVFVHTIRDPRDNVASLYDAGQKYSESWQGRQTMEACIRTYRGYLEKSRECLTRDPQRHHFIVYDNIIEQPEAQTQALWAFTGLPQQQLNLAALDSGSTALSGDEEGWKKERGPGIQDTRLVKYNRLFDDRQKQQIEEQTMELYQGIVAQAGSRVRS